MKFRRILCLLVGAVFIFATGYTAAANPLIEAADKGDMEKVETLAALGADVDARDAFGVTALTIAKQRGDKETVRILKEAGARE